MNRLEEESANYNRRKEEMEVELDAYYAEQRKRLLWMMSQEPGSQNGDNARVPCKVSPCPGCTAAIGEEHEAGCPEESCPSCGGEALRCFCNALTDSDKWAIIKGIEFDPSVAPRIHWSVAVQQNQLALIDKAAIRYFMIGNPDTTPRTMAGMLNRTIDVVADWMKVVRSYEPGIGVRVPKRSVTPHFSSVMLHF